MTTQPLSLVFEFMEHGTLREYYSTNISMSIADKISILQSIATGLVFFIIILFYLFVLLILL